MLETAFCLVFQAPLENVREEGGDLVRNPNIGMDTAMARAGSRSEGTERYISGHLDDVMSKQLGQKSCLTSSSVREAHGRQFWEVQGHKAVELGGWSKLPFVVALETLPTASSHVEEAQ